MIFLIEGHDIFPFDMGTNCLLFSASVEWVDFHDRVFASVLHGLPLAHSGGVLSEVVIWVVGGRKWVWSGFGAWLSGEGRLVVGGCLGQQRDGEAG